VFKRLLILGALVTASVGLGTAHGAPQAGRYIVVLRDGTDSAAVAAKDHGKYGAEVSQVYKHALKGYAATLTPSGLAAVSNDPSVLFVSEDREFTATADPPVTFPQVTQRSITRIGGDRSSTRSGDGRGSVPINIAVLEPFHSGHKYCRNGGTALAHHPALACQGPRWP
jgi:hypothetical protein